jgi:hypothetical protein
MTKYSMILIISVLLITGCQDDEAQAAEKKQIILDKNVLPENSEFKIEGRFGCWISQPYELTITQNGSDVKFDSNIARQGNLDYEDFKTLWKACCEGDIVSLGKSYGKSRSTADFQGKFIYKIKLKDEVISKKISLTYGAIDDEQFGKIFDKIMEAVPPDAHLPFTLYSIKALNYNELPISAMVELSGSSDEPLYTHFITLTLKEDKINISEVIVNQNGCSGHQKEISEETFMEFWKNCSSVDLVTISDSYGKRQTYDRLNWRIGIELETTKGWFTTYRRFPNKKIDDKNLSEFLKLIIDLADSNLTIPVQVE